MLLASNLTRVSARSDASFTGPIRTRTRLELGTGASEVWKPLFARLSATISASARLVAATCRKVWPTRGSWKAGASGAAGRFARAASSSLACSRLAFSRLASASASGGGADEGFVVSTGGGSMGFAAGWGLESTSTGCCGAGREPLSTMIGLPDTGARLVASAVIVVVGDEVLPTT